MTKKIRILFILFTLIIASFIVYQLSRRYLQAQTNAAIIAAAGDISPASLGAQVDTANQIAQISGLNAVLVLGDNQYPDGLLNDFNNYYNPTWGRFKSITRPVPGNHEYHTANAAGYFDYFNGLGVNIGPAGDRSKGGYYSFNISSWHFIALNSECGKSNDTNCNMTNQISWLNSDLAANQSKVCTLAYWHNPRFSSAQHHSNTRTAPFWDSLYNYRADIVLSGHDHVYERFAPQRPDQTYDPVNGIREWVAGMGGAGLYSWGATERNSEFRNNTLHGILKLTLHSTSYDWQFIDKTGVVRDQGSSSCAIGSGVTPTSGPYLSPTVHPTSTPVQPTNPVNPTRTPTPMAGCPRKSQGDADCNGIIDLIDFEIWRREFSGLATTRNADYNADGFVNLIDFEIWRRPFTGSVGPLPTNTPSVFRSPTPGSGPGELSIAVCDRANGPFTLNINNPYFPLPVGLVHVLEGGGFKVQFSVLNQTKVIGGVTTRVIEEREWLNGNLFEVSYNWFVQAPNGTVCYYGEDVFDGTGNKIGGSWIAYDDPNNPNFRPGILMPGNPAVGQTYYQEVAPPVAEDRGNNIRFEPSYTTPAGTFNNVLYVEETPPSYKRYAPGIGLIYDDGALLTVR